MFAEASYYARMALGMAQLQRAPIPADRLEPIREQLRLREERFLAMARHVLAQPQHFYRRMFDMAGCSFADLETSVGRDGLRATLEKLLDAGVYVAYDEFRGRTPIVRGGVELPWSAGDWDNPTGRGLVEQTTSGSSGKRAVTRLSHLAVMYREGYELLDLEAFDAYNRPRVVVGPILPSVWPVRRQITWQRTATPVERWLAIGGGSTAYRWMTSFLVTQIRLLGGYGVYPEFLPENDYLPAARVLAEYCRRGKPASVRAIVSAATRVAVAAREHGLDISGTLFSISGEPLTQSKRDLIESCGALAYPQYHSSDLGILGFSCPEMKRGNCVHLFEDANLILPRPRPGGYNALYLTNLLPWNPRILINLEIDDSAVIEPATCDCPYRRIGFGLQARDIFSYGKVTGQGVTVQARDLAEIVEHALPQRFGGGPGDYQLAEIEGAGQTQMILRIHPRLEAADRSAVRDRSAVHDYFLEKLRALYGGSLSDRLWQHSAGIEVRFEAPESTFTGKVHPVRLLGARLEATSDVAKGAKNAATKEKQ